MTTNRNLLTLLTTTSLSAILFLDKRPCNSKRYKSFSEIKLHRQKCSVKKCKYIGKVRIKRLLVGKTVKEFKDHVNIGCLYVTAKISLQTGPEVIKFSHAQLS